MPIFPSQKSRSNRRKWHFGKHDKSLTGLWGPSYWPQLGMAKCHFRLSPELVTGTLSKIEFCIVCEQLRPELGGKIQILGFYGVAPNVEVLTAKLGKAFAMSFLVGFAPFDLLPPKMPQHRFVVTDPSGRILVQTPPTVLNVELGKRVLVAFGAGISPTMVGRHTIKMFVESDVVLETTFQINIATAEQLRKAGVPTIQ